MADGLTTFQGFELIGGFAWGVSPYGEGRVVLTLSHPRLGPLNFIVSKDMAERIGREIAKQLATGQASPTDQTPPPPLPQMH